MWLLLFIFLWMEAFTIMRTIIRHYWMCLLNVVRKQFYFSRSIQSKIFLSFSAVVLFAIVTTSWVLYASFSRTIEHNAKTYVTDSVIHANENFELIFSDVEKISTVVILNKVNVIDYISSSSKSSVPYDNFIEQQAAEQFLSSLAAYKPYITRVAIVGRNGRIAHAGGSMLFSSIVEEPWFEQALAADNGQLLIDAPSTGEISYSRVIRHNNRPIGIVLIEFNKSFLQSLFNIKPTDSGLFFVTDPMGNRILNAGGIDVPAVFLEQAADLSLTSNRDPTFPQLLSADKVLIEGVNYLYISYQSSLTKWLTIGFIPYNKLINDALAILKRIIQFGIFIFCVVLLTSLALSRQITKGLQYLTRLMGKVREGNLEVRPRVRSRDEIGELSEGFHSMMSRIDSLMDEIKDQEKQKREVEIVALQSQIRPHFIYNTLDTVKSLARLQNVRNIEELLGAFIELLRLTLGDTREFITIKEEIEHLERYILIQRYKYLDRFIVQYQVEEGVLDCLTTKLILQPLVENAIAHAFVDVHKDLLITVKIYADNNRIKFEVTDNGIGMTADQIQQILNNKDCNLHRGGIGLRNVDERIKKLFEQPDGIHIVSEPGMYTSVEFTIPRMEGRV
ncbi:sensor histidine kinase [Paenibacillaceae bacterium]|nr:sensor histidine kinase [Paenibacillaceae bacterium]